MLEVMGIIVATLFLSMTAGAFIGIRIKNTSVVDTFWGLGPIAATWLLYTQLPSGLVQRIFSLLITAWGVRLAFFLFATRVLKRKQDNRYTQIENKWRGCKSLRTVCHFYMQATLQCFVCAAFIPIYSNLAQPLGTIQFLSILLVGVALAGEGIADIQLYLFKKQETAGVYRGGLWRYCRHPNYFFEWLAWLGIALFSYGYSSHVIAWISPLSIFIIMRFVTGPYTERLSVEKHGDEYQQYQKDVPMFWPIFLAKKRMPGD